MATLDIMKLSGPDLQRVVLFTLIETIPGRKGLVVFPSVLILGFQKAVKGSIVMHIEKQETREGARSTI